MSDFLENPEFPAFCEAPLARACRDHDTAAAIALLADGAPISPEAHFGQNLLHLALGGHTLPPTDLFEALLTAGVPPDSGGEGETPLWKIIAKALDQIVWKTRDARQFTARACSLIQLLGRHGADSNAWDRVGRTPVLVVAEFFRRPLPPWSSRECLLLIEALVFDARADLRARDDQGFTVLHHAAAARESRLISGLVKAGADPNARNVAGQTPVDQLLTTRGPESRIPEFPEEVQTAFTLLALLRNGANLPTADSSQPQLIQDLLGYLLSPEDNRQPPDCLLPLVCHWLPLLDEKSPNWWASLVTRLLDPKHFLTPFEYSWGSITLLFKSHFGALLVDRQDCPEAVKTSLCLVLHPDLG